jgi:hypothetical protein
MKFGDIPAISNIQFRTVSSVHYLVATRATILFHALYTHIMHGTKLIIWTQERMNGRMEKIPE